MATGFQYIPRNEDQGPNLVAQGKEFVRLAHSEQTLFLPKELVAVMSIVGKQVAQQLLAQGEIELVEEMLDANNSMIDRILGAERES